MNLNIKTLIKKIAKFQEEFLDKFDTSNNIYIYIYECRWLTSICLSYEIGNILEVTLSICLS